MSSIDWDEYFMLLAIINSKRSKDPKTKVGAIIHDKNKKIISTGYNGFPRSEDQNEELYSWDKGIKELFVIHAEVNCIFNAKSNIPEDSTMYCTLFPCNKCAQSIVQVGIKNLVYLDEKPTSEIFQASKRILKNGNVNVIKYKKRDKLLEIKY